MNVKTHTHTFLQASSSNTNRRSHQSRSVGDSHFRLANSSLGTLSENPGISLADLAKRQKRLPIQNHVRTKESTSIQDFQFIKVLGKGCMGKVSLIHSGSCVEKKQCLTII